LVEFAAPTGIGVAQVTCRDEDVRWSEVEVQDHFRIVLVVRGRFRRRGSGGSAELDRTVGYVGLPGEEEHFAHPDGGDVCTLITLDRERWSLLVGDQPQAIRSFLYVDSEVDLSHRRVLAGAHRADPGYALLESLLGLLGPVLRATVGGRTSASQSSADDGRAVAPAADRRLVAVARAAIEADDEAAQGLLALAARLGVSPYRLSRAFSREMGVSLTRYRNRVRVGRALDRLAAGETSLAALAADLGFADQSHLSRTVRDQVGHTPAVLRRLLADPH
jgi:AraC-like DNA-binding protein